MTRSSDSWGHGPAGRSRPMSATVAGGVLAVGLAISLGACETRDDGGTQGAATTEASAASPMIDPTGPIGASPLPRMTVGDTYVFDNPRERWTVQSVTEDRVTWTSDQGATRVTSGNPLMPSLESSAPSIGQVTRIVQSQTGSLWPLAVGNETSFVVAVGMEQPPYSQSLAWNCRVVGVSRIEVPAGTFNTHKVACARSDGLRLNTYHAPTVGYFVRREVTTADQRTETRSLVSFDNAASAAASPMTAGGPPPATAPAASVEATPLAPPPGEGGTARPSAPAPVMGAAPVRAPDPAPAAPRPSAASAPAPAPAPVAAAPAPSPSPASAVPASGWRGAGVRLASFGSAQAARTGWSKFQAAYPQLLQGLTPRLDPVDLGDRGTWHRLYAGPFESAAQARGLCGRISEMGDVCDVKTF
ncbi:SPOR domain-containing protein [Roseospira navarrensis]|nr:SPOR domain-containing protein [Roseospira navarrensis]